MKTKQVETFMWFYRIVLGVMVLLVASCSVLAQPTPTPTSTPTETPTITPLPSNTPTITPIPATDTPTNTPEPTLTPSPIPTETPIPTPTTTPEATVFFTNDNWENMDIPSDMGVRLNNPMVAFLNTNNRTGSAATPLPGNNIETLYYVSPTNSAGRVAIKQFDASTAGQIYLAPTGNAFAYMRFNAGTASNGLYIADVEIGISGRVLPLESLTQRGIFSAPSWKADGSQIAIAVATGYDMDIYSIARGGGWGTLISDGSYDFWPVWSPDGNYLAFVSDRVTCPSWRPGEPGTCDGTATTPPSGGHVFMLEVATGAITQVSDVVVYEPPRWATPRHITYAVGDPLFGDPERELYIADIFSRNIRSVHLISNDVPLKLAEAWSPNGQQVLFQEAANSTTDLVLAQASGTELGRITDLPYSRYGMSASWSPDGSLLAIGGVGGQCPFGIVVTDTTLTTIARGNPPPTMCEPVYSPDGRWIAFTGIIPNRDGRVDVYTSNQNGFGAVNLTGSLLGNIDMLGWVGGT